MTDQNQERELVMEAHALVGAVSTGFSSLEFHLQFVLVLLASSKELSSETIILLRDRQFAQKIRLLKDLVNFRFPNGSELRKQGLAIVKRLDALRQKRNLYVHGYWLINYELISTIGGVRCSNTRWRFDKKTENWITMESTDIPLESLREQISENKSIFDDLYTFNENVRTELARDSGTEGLEKVEVGYPDAVAN